MVARVAASRARPSRPRRARAPSAAAPRPRSRTSSAPGPGRNGLARHDGGSRPERPRRRPPAARPRRKHRMSTTVSTRTSLDRAVERRDGAAALAPAPGRLVVRRARVERDDDRAAPLLAPRARPAHAGARPQDRERAARAAARRRHLVDLVRRPGRPLDDDRGVRRDEARRGRPGPKALAYIRRRAGSRRAASSRSASSRCSGTGRGSGSRRSRSRSCCCRRARRSRSTTSPAGRARRSSRSPPCRRSGPVRPALIDLREIGSRPGQTRRPPRPSAIRRRAMRQAVQWVRERQEADGSWGGIQPPWVWSIVLLASLGHGFEDETLRRAVEGWEGFTIDDGDRLRPEACQSPVWDTALAVIALRDAGLARRPSRAAPRRRVPALAGGHGQGRLGDPPAGARAGRLGVRVRERPLPGRRRHGGRRDRAAHARDRRRRGRARPRLDRRHAVARRRLGRLRRRQRRALALPDPVLRLRPRHRRAERRRHRPRDRGARPDARLDHVVANGVRWLLDEQEDDGSWYGRWGVNHVYGTGAALPALEAAASTRRTPPTGARSPGSTRSRTRTAASARTSGATPTLLARPGNLDP